MADMTLMFHEIIVRYVTCPPVDPVSGQFLQQHCVDDSIKKVRLVGLKPITWFPAYHFIGKDWTHEPVFFLTWRWTWLVQWLPLKRCNKSVVSALSCVNHWETLEFPIDLPFPNHPSINLPSDICWLKANVQHLLKAPKGRYELVNLGTAEDKQDYPLVN